ncbi:MAG TPA: inositol monophosphatase [Patescibacteria group bacterium]|nr:inositol monophosphatase [Patescibacteria group bacterium]
MDYRQFLKETLHEAANLANESFGKVSGITKGDDNNQVLTETDLAIGKLLIEKIKQTYPDYNIIDEETESIDNHSEYTWVIDPIDGTSNFANGVPTYGIMLGLLKNQTPIAGGFIIPPTNELYLAEKGSGTTLNSKHISVTKENNLLNCLVAYGIDGHQENPELTRNEAKLVGEIVLNIRNLRSSGSEPIDVGYVASGRYGARLNQYGKIWDVVAPQIIVEEAGGTFTDFWGKSQNYSNPLTKTTLNYTVCAAAPAIHKQLQKIIHKQ